MKLTIQVLASIAILGILSGCASLSDLIGVASVASPKHAGELAALESVVFKKASPIAGMEYQETTYYDGKVADVEKFEVERRYVQRLKGRAAVSNIVASAAASAAEEKKTFSDDEAEMAANLESARKLAEAAASVAEGK